MRPPSDRWRELCLLSVLFRSLPPWSVGLGLVTLTVIVSLCAEYRALKTRTQQYFYEPLLLLDPKKIQSHVNKVTGKTYVRFPVHLWDKEVERQVMAWIKKLPDSSPDVDEWSVQVMPYDELRLITTGDLASSGSYHPSTNATSFQYLDQQLQFHLFCGNQKTADNLVKSFQEDAAYSVQDLKLECITIGESNRQQPRLLHAASDDVVRRSKHLQFNIDQQKEKRKKKVPKEWDNLDVSHPPDMGRLIGLTI